MADVRHIHVVSEPGERFQRRHLIRVLADLWREAGHRVVLGGAPGADDADLFILHTDRSRVAPAMVPQRAGIPVLNGRALDITKRTVSRQLVDKASDWAGPVLVKTDANAHAGEEYALFRLDLPRLARIFAGAVVPWQWTGQLPFRTYPVLASAREVPDWVWRDPGLVVEKFRPERDGPHYVLRQWLFFGSQGYCVKILGELPLVKSRRIVDVTLIEGPPEPVQAARERLGLDFGKIDYVEVDGEVIVLDANKTPTVYLAEGKPGRLVRSLAAGLDDVR